jgi:hypothetical protein
MMKDGKMWVWFVFSVGFWWKGAWLLILGQTKVFFRGEGPHAEMDCLGFVLSMCVSGRAAEVVTLLLPSMRIDGVG